MSHSYFIHLSIGGHLGCFQILAIYISNAMNITLLMFFRISILGSFGYIFRNGIVGSKGRPIFNFLRYFHTAFHSGCTSLHQQQPFYYTLICSNTGSSYLCVPSCFSKIRCFIHLLGFQSCIII